MPRDLGGTTPRTLIVGCEPASIADGMQLSPEVDAAIEVAIARIRSLLEEHR